MCNVMRFSSVVIFATAVAATTLAQDAPPPLKARELFYNPIVPARPAPKQEATPIKEAAPVKEAVPVKEAIPATKPETQPKHVSSSKKSGVRPSKKQEAKSMTPVAPSAERTRVATGNPQQSGATFQNVSLSNTNTIPLAFRYTIQRKNVAGKFEDASVDATFRSGDRVRVTIESNDNAYLYIVQQGSRKTWNVLFPASNINGGANEVKANAKITIPSEYAFSFDDQPGTENVYIVLSRKPEADFEKLIFALRDKSGAGPDVQALPVNNETRNKGKVMELASSRTNNPLLAQLELMKSRDLVFEKVDEDNDQGPKEKAFYAGTPDTSINARVVARVELKHE